MNLSALILWITGLFSGPKPDVFGLVKLCLIMNAVMLSICLALYAVREALIRAAAIKGREPAGASPIVRSKDEDNNSD